MSAPPPTFIVIGHAARDLLPTGGWRLGGTVTYAALTARRLGVRAGILTSGPPDVLAALAAAAPDVALATVPAADATTFENIYVNGVRRQWLRARATPLGEADLPATWRQAEIVMLAPIAREVDPALAHAFPDALVGATPQGWLRRWDDAGHVFPDALGEAESALASLRALILSIDDLPPPGAALVTAEDIPTTRPDAEQCITAWARIVPLVAVTAGHQGARLFTRGTAPVHFAADAVDEVDPTGAGDVFAAAFLCRLAATGDPHAAMRTATHVAALSIQHEGTAGIPTLAEVTARFGAE